ncbi:sarcosine dehydrogenase, mitochondrial-like isoform X2 [Watersipora subatra]
MIRLQLSRQFSRSRIPQLSRLCSTHTEKKEVPYKTLKDEKGTDNSLNFPKSADAVVLGGGVSGCSVLYHLSKLGLKNSVLIEKEQLTAGTTWHTAGLLWRLRPNETETLLCNITRDLLDTLEEETGVHSGFHMNGGVFTAMSKERLAEYKRLKTFGEYMGVESHILSPEDLKQLYPILNTDDLVGAIFSPTDGHIDPAGYCTALSRAAKQNGAQLFTGCAAYDIETRVDENGKRRVKAVNTQHGRIETDNVVVCGGCWAPYMVKSLGVHLPQYTFRHSYVVTEIIEEVKGKPSLRDHDMSTYLKVQGDVLHIGGYEPNPVILDEGVPKDFAFGLFELDWDAFGVHIEKACERIPAVNEIGIKSTVSGPESFTPDGAPLMGPNPDIAGLFHSHAYNSGGVMMSGGSGRMLAQWVINGEPELDMFSYDIRRFNKKLLASNDWLREQSHEHYGKHYSTHYHMDEPLGGRNIMKDVLHEKLLEEGCFYQFKGGWERPGWFNKDQIAPVLPYDYYGAYGYKKNTPNPYVDRLEMDYTFDFPKQHAMIGEECMNARTNANLFNMSYFGKYYLTGQDSTEAAEWIFSNHMDKEPGSTTYTCMLNKLGGIESDLTVSVVDDDGPQHTLGVTGKSYYAAVGGGFSPYVKAKIENIILEKGFNCKVHDLSHDMVLLSLQGPKSREILSRLCPGTDFSNDAFPFASHQLVQVGGHKVRAMRLSFVGELGWELHASNESALNVYEAVMSAGKDLGIRNSGYRAMDSLSMEKGYRMWHSDIRSDDSPLEADLGFTCKLKSDKQFLGREALEAYKKKGLNKRLVCFTLNEPAALHGLETIYRDGEIVGYIRRAEYAFALDKVIAWGYVRNPNGSAVQKDFIESGKYQLDRMGERLSASAYLKSPFDMQNNRLMGIYD